YLRLLRSYPCEEGKPCCNYWIGWADPYKIAKEAQGCFTKHQYTEVCCASAVRGKLGYHYKGKNWYVKKGRDDEFYPSFWLFADDPANTTGDLVELPVLPDPEGDIVGCRMEDQIHFKPLGQLHRLGPFRPKDEGELMPSGGPRKF